MHRYGITLLAAIGALAAVSAGRPSLVSEARADSCCSGPYITGVVIGGGGFIGDMRSVGPTTGNLKDDSAQDSVGGRRRRLRLQLEAPWARRSGPRSNTPT
jgi:hypothetical protein